MRTRIISGAALVLIVSALVTFHILTDIPFVMIAALAFVTGVAAYELSYNAKLVCDKILGFMSGIFSALEFVLYVMYPSYAIYSAILYVLFVMAVALFRHQTVNNTDIMSAVAVPLMLSFAVFCIYAVLSKGLFYLLLMLNFSSVCDCGAYFVGVTIGRHKLCPKISPKKTVEGAIGGILLSVLVTVLLYFLFGLENGLLPLILITPVLCVVGMMGDLFASVIKRKAEIKDYGKLIPGHGGIMDRFDSILLIAPAFLLLLTVIRG